MAPAQVWVIYNKYAKEIVWVAAEQFIAQHKWDELVEEKSSNPMVPNKTKFVVCTLKRALDEIASEHEAHISYLKEEYDQQLKWNCT